MEIPIPKQKSIIRIVAIVASCVFVACGDTGAGPPEEPERLDVRWVSVALMDGWVYSSCGLTEEGTAYCWGQNFGFTVGHPLLDVGPYDGSANEPIPVDGGIAFRQITAGHEHTCGLSRAGDAYCWGQTGQQGYDSKAWTPQRIPGGVTFNLLDAGTGSTCGLLEDGTAYCWTGHENQPVAVPGGLTFKDLGSDECGISVEGDLYCWQIPLWSQQEHWTEEPTLVGAGLGLEVLDDHRLCALDQAGAIHCWSSEGTHYHKEMGGVSLKFLAMPCGIAVDGSAYCWRGDDPIRVPGGINFETLSFVDTHMCGTTPDGRAYCWGCNAYGQLGDGSEPVSGFGCGPDNAPIGSQLRLVKNPRK